MTLGLPRLGDSLPPERAVQRCKPVSQVLLAAVEVLSLAVAEHLWLSSCRASIASGANQLPSPKLVGKPTQSIQ